MAVAFAVCTPCSNGDEPAETGAGRAGAPQLPLAAPREFVRLSVLNHCAN